MQTKFPSFHVSSTKKAMHDERNLSRAEALELAREGGAVLCLDVPEGTEFGIDMRSYAVGPHFEGVKMVPPRGVHFVTCGNDIDRHGFFVRLGRSDVCVMRWEPATELIRPVEEADEVSRRSSAVRNMEYDRTLGPYPLSTESEWAGLSGYVSDAVLRRAGIPAGTIVGPGALDDDHALMAQLQPQPQLEPQPRWQQQDAADSVAGMPCDASFVELDPRRRRREPGAAGTAGELVGAALSEFHIDKSGWLRELLSGPYAGEAGDAEAAECSLLGELQLAFILFLRLSSFRALQHWKLVLRLVFGCEAALAAMPRFYCRLLVLLRAQLALAPDDFFDDPVSEDNFLRTALATLSENAEAAHAAAPLPPELRAELDQLWTFLGKQFGLSEGQLRLSAMDDDDEPVVVDMPDSRASDHFHVSV